ncbi:MAG: hypothetical protein KAR79_01215 [Simkaniaceae bacterium]|nr:hypothetical protein [Simkaniaceae bacterium]
MNKESLASIFVKSPDPRQKKVPIGEQLIVHWKVPTRELQEGLILKLEILYKNLSQEVLEFPLGKGRGFQIYPLLDEKYLETEGFLTYKVEIVNSKGRTVKSWKQRLWTELITLDKQHIPLEWTPLQE